MNVKNPFLLFVVVFNSVGAFAETQMGTYSAATESEWGVAFELKSGGLAVVTTEYNYDYDEHDKRVEHKKTVTGKWTMQGSSLTLAYGHFKDTFEYKSDCDEKKPCYKFKNSTGKGMSPLNVEYEFINWDAEASQSQKFRKK